MGVFLVLDLLLFYILFEGILIPMFLLIGVEVPEKKRYVLLIIFFFILLRDRCLCFWASFNYIVLQEQLIIRYY